MLSSSISKNTYLLVYFKTNILVIKYFILAKIIELNDTNDDIDISLRAAFKTYKMKKYRRGFYILLIPYKEWLISIFNYLEDVIFRCNFS